jgi:hypothetical protein
VFLSIGCVRHYGGLHSSVYNSGAGVAINGRALDYINLRVRPDENSDYFHRPPPPRGAPDLPPFNACATVYIWPVPRPLLDSDSTHQLVTVTIDPHVAWDIDYIGFICDAPPRIFISYSHMDARIAIDLKRKLVDLGISTWIDTEEIKVGGSLIAHIQDGLSRVQFVCALLSRYSIRSRWVQKELEVAMIRELQGEAITVLPVVLDDCELPLFLRDKKYADLRPPRKYTLVARQIEAAVQGKTRE